MTRKVPVVEMFNLGQDDDDPADVAKTGWPSKENTESARLQPSDPMIADLVHSQGQRGQRLVLRRKIEGRFTDYANARNMEPMYVEARAIESGVYLPHAVHPTPYIRVWVDSHVVELRVQHLPDRLISCTSSTLPLIGGRRWESIGPVSSPSFVDSAVYIVIYDAPILPSVSAHIERVKESLPPPLAGVHDLIDLVAQMLHS
jgi:hypothetical protein